MRESLFKGTTSLYDQRVRGAVQGLSPGAEPSHRVFLVCATGHSPPGVAIYGDHPSLGRTKHILSDWDEATLLCILYIMSPG